jgi:hypothetical protein
MIGCEKKFNFCGETRVAAAGRRGAPRAEFSPGRGTATEPQKTAVPELGVTQFRHYFS